MPSAALRVALASFLAAPAWSQSSPGAPITAAAIPPGTVLIPSGKAHIGTPSDEVMKVGQESETRFLNTVCETPQHERRIDAFYLGVSEVTNEQYAQFVAATGARPPDAWGLEAIDEASRRYTEELGRVRQDAQKNGQPQPKVEKFDQVEWWNKNWRTVQWKIPPGQETVPAGYVDYDEALRYTRWAGARLMTEFEYQRAGRGSTRNVYPWGDKWDDKKCANQTTGAKHPSPVGSFPEGQTAQGVCDLSGNVWEWTSSPFLAYPGFKVLQIKVGPPSAQRTIDGVVDWGNDRRVVVGGSFQETAVAARLTTRRPTEHNQSAEGLGFRIAASVSPGVDLAQSILDLDLAANAAVLPPGVGFDPSDVVIADRWTSTRGTAQVPSYGVITGYDYVLFFSATGLDFAALGQLEQLSLERGPVYLGVFSSSRPALQPALPKGTYLVAFRAAGPLREHESIGAAAAATPPKQGILRKQQGKNAPLPAMLYPAGMRPDVRNLIFFDPKGTAVAALPASDMEYLRPDAGGVTIVPPAAPDANAPPPATPPTVEPRVTVTLRAHARVKVANKGFVFSIPLEFRAGDVTAEWRH